MAHGKFGWPGPVQRWDGEIIKNCVDVLHPRDSQCVFSKHIKRVVLQFGTTTHAAKAVAAKGALSDSHIPSGALHATFRQAGKPQLYEPIRRIMVGDPSVHSGTGSL